MEIKDLPKLLSATSFIREPLGESRALQESESLRETLKEYRERTVEDESSRNKFVINNGKKQEI